MDDDELLEIVEDMIEEELISDSYDDVSYGMPTVNEEDVSAINNRAKNQSNYVDNFGKKRKESNSNNEDDESEEDLENNSDGSSGKEKENTKDQDDTKSEKETKSQDNSDKNKKNNNNKTDGKKEEKKDKDQENDKKGIKDKIINKGKKDANPLKEGINRKLKKLKIKLILIGIGIFASVFVGLALFFAIDAALNSISSFFGIKEDDSDDSVFQDDKYLVNPDTGDYYNNDELVEALKDDNSCPDTFWVRIKDSLSSQFNGDPCKFIRYVKSTAEDLEKDFPGLKVDRGIILSSIFYGYAMQPDYSEYEDSQNAPEKVNAVEHYEGLIDMLSNGKLTKQDLDDIIFNSLVAIYKTSSNWTSNDKNIQFSDSVYTQTGGIFPDVDELHYKTYRWKVTVSNNGNTAKGSCEEASRSYYRYSTERLEIFFRFGADVAHYYDLFLGRDRAYSESDPECNGSQTKEELKSIVASTGATNISIDEKSIDKAFEYLKRGPISEMELFKQKANTEGYRKDTFSPLTTNAGETIEFDYRNGFVYKRFPYFERSYNGEDGETILEYDDAITPKIIETVIQNIIEKKSSMNEILHLEDTDNPDSNENFSSMWSSVNSAYCSNYVSVPFNEIEVRLADCAGAEFGSTNFKDYIMGVAYGEVSDRNDDYVKAQMVAAMSYALHRRSNYNNVPSILMKSGTCDQVYCSMSSGCSINSATKYPSYLPGVNYSNYKIYHGAAGVALMEKYSRFYDEASQFLLVKDGVPFNAHYVSTIQDGWYKKAKNGMSFTQIMQETYAEEGAELVKCEILGESSEDSSTTDTKDMGNGAVEVKKIGNKKTEKYNQVSPDMGIFYGYSYSDEPEGRNITINPEWINANIVNIKTNSSVWNAEFKVNRAASGNFALAYGKISNILTNGVNISDGSICKYSANDLQGGSTFEQRKTTSGIYSLASYGIMQSWNYNSSYTINNKVYKPYSPLSTINDYNDFVSALGKEEDCRNINYILYKYAYEPAGFTWGRYDETYDGSIFKVKY